MHSLQPVCSSKKVSPNTNCNPQPTLFLFDHPIEIIYFSISAMPYSLCIFIIYTCIPHTYFTFTWLVLKSPSECNLNHLPTHFTTMTTHSTFLLNPCVLYINLFLSWQGMQFYYSDVWKFYKSVVISDVEGVKNHPQLETHPYFSLPLACIAHHFVALVAGI